jgi:phosphatidylinositol-4,5-bisphosphate 3-kinase
LFGTIMNSAWEIQSLPLRLCLYSCIELGNNCGFIEVVPHCTGLADVQGNTMEGAMNKDSLLNWLRKNRTRELSWDACVDNFMHSLAASCVFEYVLGLGDRHSGNVLIRTDGTLFHIDMAWFLGHEYPHPAAQQPFTLTSSMIELLDGPEGRRFARFRELAVRGFMEVRKQHALLCSLLMLAVPAGLRHLTRVEDVYYLRDALAVDQSDDEAAKTFLSLLQSTNRMLVQLDHGFHNMVVSKRGY